jgi:hypothetical protein
MAPVGVGRGAVWEARAVLVLAVSWTGDTTMRKKRSGACLQVGGTVRTGHVCFAAMVQRGSFAHCRLCLSGGYSSSDCLRETQLTRAIPVVSKRMRRCLG